jgi:hypothetical protein
MAFGAPMKAARFASCIQKGTATTRTYRDRAAIIKVSPRVKIMEAEQLNALANTLADLKDRAGQLRRYL